MKLSEMTKEELNALKDEEVAPYIQQWFDYLIRVLSRAGKGKTAAMKLYNTLNSQKEELTYVLMFTIKPEWRPQIVQIFDRLAKLEVEGKR